LKANRSPKIQEFTKMKKQKILIVGGVAGGASAATRLRRLMEEPEIIIFERGEYVSFANCGLPYYIGKAVKNRDDLLVATPEMLSAYFRIDVRTNSEVIRVDTKQKKVRVNSVLQGEYEESYDQLILSPGAKPVRPNLPGIDDLRVFSLRNIPDMDRIKQAVEGQGIQNVIVIGGGFIGIEMAENLYNLGLNISIIEGLQHILVPFDDDIVPLIEFSIRQAGINLLTDQKVKALHPSKDHLSVELESGERVDGQLVILAIGVQPDTLFLKDSGIELGTRGHLIVDERMRTSVEGIYAVGDAVEVAHYVDGSKTAIPLAGPANKQGRIAADQIAGIDSAYKGTQGTAIIKWLHLTAACTGLNERTLKQSGIEYNVAHVHPTSHSGFYPGASTLTLKVIADTKTGRILGAQGIGKSGVDKRIDVIATLIRMQGTVDDLLDLELCYAPPFSSAKDPVNMAAMVLQNARNGLAQLISPLEWLNAEPEESEDIQILDVTTKREHSKGHIPGAVNIPIHQLRSRLSELNPKKPVWLHCAVGYRGYIASRILMHNGFSDVKNLTGGYVSYKVLKS
jgi:NADPH-dependent 2,4-dienoyl-CoA reductase/sulfur reductase-like enzyme/rhodanese-related sulfurtransferase